MANTLPGTIAGRLEFFTQRLPAWAADPAAIGLTAPQIAELQTTLTLAGNAHSTVLATRQLAKNQTATQNAAMENLLDLGTGMIAAIKAFADLSDDPTAVFQTAEIDPPEGRSTPLPPPAEATNLSTELLNSGAVRVSWKGTIANGTFYDVYRELDGETGFTLIGSSAMRSFDDTTVPAGTTRAMYYTITRRDDLTSGESEPTLIRFGVQSPMPSGGATLGLAA